MRFVALEIGRDCIVNLGHRLIGIEVLIGILRFPLVIGKTGITLQEVLVCPGHPSRVPSAVNVVVKAVHTHDIPRMRLAALDGDSGNNPR